MQPEGPRTWPWHIFRAAQWDRARFGITQSIQGAEATCAAGVSASVRNVADGQSVRELFQKVCGNGRPRAQLPAQFADGPNPSWGGRSRSRTDTRTGIPQCGHQPSGSANSTSSRMRTDDAPTCNLQTDNHGSVVLIEWLCGTNCAANCSVRKKTNVLMQVVVGLRARPHSTIVRACTEPDGQCRFFARRTAPHGRRIPRSQEQGARSKEGRGVGRRVLAPKIGAVRRHVLAPKRRLEGAGSRHPRGPNVWPPRVARSGACEAPVLAGIEGGKRQRGIRRREAPLFGAQNGASKAPDPATRGGQTWPRGWRDSAP